MAEACHRAIEKGIAIGEGKPTCRGVLLRSVEDVYTGLQNIPTTASRALVSFVTPLGQSQKKEDSLSPGNCFLHDLTARIETIARWHGVSLEGEDKLDQVIGQTELEEKGLGLVEWNRRVSQQGGAAIAMKGQMGLLQILPEAASDADLLWMLHIGSLLHVGSHLAFGQGRYDLHLVEG